MVRTLRILNWNGSNLRLHSHAYRLLEAQEDTIRIIQNDRSFIEDIGIVGILNGWMYRIVRELHILRIYHENFTRVKNSEVLAHANSSFKTTECIAHCPN